MSMHWYFVKSFGTVLVAGTALMVHLSFKPLGYIGQVLGPISNHGTYSRHKYVTPILKHIQTLKIAVPQHQEDMIL